MIHTYTRKSKPRKVPKTVQAEHDAWMKSIQSMSTNFSRTKSKQVKPISPVVTGVYVRETRKIQSLDTGLVAPTKAEPKVYTGSSMKGIATMHKSNAVPVFTDEQAKDISSMRR